MRRFILCFVCLMNVLFLTRLNAQDKNGVYATAEELPAFIGGDQALYNWIEDNMHPVCGCKGKAIVKFVVLEDGAIGNVEILRPSTNPKHNEEAIRLIKSMPKWKPARQKKVAVKCYYTLPINIDAPVVISDNGSTITGKVDCCPDEYWEWKLDKQKQVLTVSGPAKIKWNKLWENVSTVEITANVTNMDFLHKCHKLKKIQVDSENIEYASIDGVLVNKEKDALLFFPEGLKKQKYIIPNGIKRISGGAFDNVQIDTLVITSDVEQIYGDFKKANIKCFVLKNNHSFIIRNGILCKNDTTCTFYYPSTMPDIPHISASQFTEEVLEYRQNSFVFKGEKPVIIVFSPEQCRPSDKFAYKMKMLYAEYKDVVDFYLMDGNSRETLKILKICEISDLPALCMMNGEFQGQLFYSRKGEGDLLKNWEGYNVLHQTIEEMLSGKKNIPTQK